MVEQMQSHSGSQTTWRSALIQAGFLMLLAILTTAILWGLRSDKLPLVADPAVYQLELTAPLVELPEALVYYDEGEYLFVDVRSNGSASAKTIPGSFIIREDTLDDDLAANMEFLFPEDKIVLFGSGDLMAPANIAARLQERGFQDLTILKGGIEEWTAAGGEISDRVQPGLEDAS